MEFTWVRVVNDQVVSPNPAKIGSVIVTPEDSGGNCSITLHDGESAQDPEILTIRTRQAVTRAINFSPYLQTKRGLYVNIVAAAEEVLIQLNWDKE